MTSLRIRPAIAVAMAVFAIGFAATTGIGHAADRSGYWMVDRSGQVYAFGDAPDYGGVPNNRYPHDCGRQTPEYISDLGPTPDGGGYALLDSDGGVWSLGNAAFQGGFTNVDKCNPNGYSAGPVGPSLANDEKTIGINFVPDGKSGGDGYWIFTTRGRAEPFGVAKSYGDMRDTKLNGPVRDATPTPTGRGYYMVGSDGGVFNFGDARFAGSMGDKKLNAPVVSLAPDPDGQGYWLVASDGGVFAFDAAFHGSMGDVKLSKPIIGIAAYGDGYLMVGSDGGIFDFSNKPYDGSLGDHPPAQPVSAVALLPT